MAKRTQQPRPTIWKRLFAEPPPSQEVMIDPRPVFLACSLVALAAGVIGWTMASVNPGWIVPVCSVIAILAGLLGVRSKLRSLGVIGFVMGMFLLPNAVNITIQLFSA